MSNIYYEYFKEVELRENLEGQIFSLNEKKEVCIDEIDVLKDKILAALEAAKIALPVVILLSGNKCLIIENDKELRIRDTLESQTLELPSATEIF